MRATMALRNVIKYQMIRELRDKTMIKLIAKA